MEVKPVATDTQPIAKVRKSVSKLGSKPHNGIQCDAPASDIALGFRLSEPEASCSFGGAWSQDAFWLRPAAAG